MDIEPKVIYKVYSQGIYLGLLPTPRSPFSYSQDMNTGATEVVLSVPQTLDNAAEDVEPITDESGIPLTTEDDEVITTETATDIVGVSGSGALIANDNDIEAWSFSDDNPNGVLLFAGYISRWKGVIGSGNELEITITSLGKDLVDYIFGNDASVLEVSQTTANDSNGLHRPDQPSSQVEYVAESLVGLDFLLSKIQISLACGNRDGGPSPSSASVTVKVWQGSPGGAGALVSSTTAFIANQAPAFEYVSFAISPGIDLSSGSYWFSVEADDYVEIQFATSNAFANGTFYYSVDFVAWPSDPSLDLTFKLYSGSLLTDATFTAYDPSDMIRDAIDGYNAQGGIVRYTDDSIGNTGLSLNYEFKTATAAEIISKARELAPSNWFWYVDPATQILYFKEPG